MHTSAIRRRGPDLDSVEGEEEEDSIQEELKERIASLNTGRHSGLGQCWMQPRLTV